MIILIVLVFVYPIHSFDGFLVAEFLFYCHSRHKASPPRVIACKVTCNSPYDSMFKPLFLVPSSRIFGSRSSGFRSVNQLDNDDQRFEHCAVKMGECMVVRFPLSGT